MSWIVWSGKHIHMSCNFIFIICPNNMKYMLSVFWRWFYKRSVIWKVWIRLFFIDFQL
ncbi:hypothetical protein BC833DRAFT_597724 [Globomyces pollinis-pini]|nr:hypothetical protein BC833DRAFT_597724 [Globomyces pollinis-pini]